MKFYARAVRLDMEDIGKLRTPCILHWNLNHFVVLKKITNDSIWIHDPAKGEVRLSFDDVSKCFTGIALEITPSNDFEIGSDKTKVPLAGILNNIRGLKRGLLQVFLLSIFIQLFVIILPFYSQIAIDEIVLSRDYGFLIALTAGFALIVCMDAGVKALRGLLVLFMGGQINVQLGTNLFRHLLLLPMDYFEKRHVGDVVSRFNSLEEIKRMISEGVVEVVVDGVMMLATLLIMFAYSPALATFVLLSILLYAMFRVLFYAPFRSAMEEKVVAIADENTNFIETVRGIQSIKLFGRELQRRNVWQNKYTQVLNAEIKFGKLEIIFKAINDLIFGLANVLVICIAVLKIIDGEITIGMFFAFMVYKMQFNQRSEALIDQYIDFRLLKVYLSRIGDIVHSEIETGLGNRDDGVTFDGALAMKDITFRYSEGENYLFENFNVEIGQGDRGPFRVRQEHIDENYAWIAKTRKWKSTR
jgi:ATP-binding cassette subfamily B protein RaxB